MRGALTRAARGRPCSPPPLCWSGRLALALLAASAPAAAAGCPAGASGVEVSVRGATPAFEAAVREELASELERQKICASGGDQALARIEIVVEADDEVRVRIVDAVTRKTVERGMSVRGLPADGRALPVAIAADELLRASWAEIALRPRETRSEVPEAVREAVEPAVAAPGPAPAFERRHEVGARVTTARYGGGHEQRGLALFYARDLSPRWTAEVAAHGRLGREVPSDHGSVEERSVGGALRLGLHLVRRGPLRLGPQLGAEASHTRFTGRAGGEARAATLDVATVFGSLGLAAAVELAPVRVSLAALALAPLRSARALDGASEATALGGLSWSGALGLGWGF